MSNNKSRELFLLFPFTGIIPEGYSCIYMHTFPNDEPPYLMVTFWGSGQYSAPVYEEDGESVFHYLIRTKDAENFVAQKNNAQREYCDYYLEGIYTRNAGEHSMTPEQYAKGANIRRPKIRYMDTAPIHNYRKL